MGPVQSVKNAVNHWISERDVVFHWVRCVRHNALKEFVGSGWICMFSWTLSICCVVHSSKRTSSHVCTYLSIMSKNITERCMQECKTQTVQIYKHIHKTHKHIIHKQLNKQTNKQTNAQVQTSMQLYKLTLLADQMLHKYSHTYKDTYVRTCTPKWTQSYIRTCFTRTNLHTYKQWTYTYVLHASYSATAIHSYVHLFDQTPMSTFCNFPTHKHTYLNITEHAQHKCSQLHAKAQKHKNKQSMPATKPANSICQTLAPSSLSTAPALVSYCGGNQSKRKTI